VFNLTFIHKLRVSLPTCPHSLHVIHTARLGGSAFHWILRTFMNIFSLSHLLELVKELPDPKQFVNANRGRSFVIRLPVRDWDAVRDADHPDREFEAHENAYVEFEIIQWKNTKGVSAPRWVLRGLVAM
jgi:hypothetical protein